MSTWKAFAYSSALHIALFGVLFFADTAESSLDSGQITSLNISIKHYAPPKEEPKPKEASTPPQEVIKNDVKIDKPKEIKKKQEKVAKTEKREREQKSTESKAENTQETMQESTPKITQENSPQPTHTISKDQILEKIRSIILAHKTYPKRAQRLGLEGEVIISFHLDGNRVLDVSIKNSSGHTILDAHALEIIQNASKEFPTLEDKIYVEVPIRFFLI